MPCMGPTIPYGRVADEAYRMTNAILTILNKSNDLYTPNGTFQMRNRHKYELYMVIHEMLVEDIYASF